MANLFIPNNWNEDYYPTANDLVYEVEASVPTVLSISNVTIKNKFPITETRKYLYRGTDPAFDPSGSNISFRLEPRIISQPKYGTVEIYDGTKFRYVPRPGFLGKDTFRYHLLVTEKSSNIGTVEVYVGVQARFPLCSTTYNARSETIQEGVALGYQIYLCKPAYSAFTFNVPLKISEYVGEYAESSDPVITEGEEGEEDTVVHPNRRFLDISVINLDYKEPIDPDDDNPPNILSKFQFEFDAKDAVEGVQMQFPVTIDHARLRNILIIVTKGTDQTSSNSDESEFVEPFVDFTSAKVEVGKFSIKLT